MLTRHNLTIIEFYIILDLQNTRQSTDWKHLLLLFYCYKAEAAGRAGRNSISFSSSSCSSTIRSMAVTCFSSPHILVQKSGPVIKPVSKFWMLKQSSHIQLKKAPALSVRSSMKDKVFENQAEGIVCYRDESGEIICEGLDEGPRFHQPLPSSSNHSRDAEIINLLQQRLQQIVNGGEFSNTDNGVIAGKEDCNQNGLNRFC
ncbi:hypothetical protein OIU77_027602 [Salix suchowensis]|uniref:Uncharacterized protein n=1 Tax=Salix suchowensis TaxID=1278906 RepID=A0ABQ9BQ73_9ROSI|nr:hypothetical protein OIU77_027602 [Salix suchowensis]